MPLVGRARHLEALADAFADDEARGGRSAFYVHGRSGVGKSALVQRFLDDLVERDEAVVLAGPLLRAGVGAVQGPRQPDRCPEPVPQAPAAARRCRRCCRATSRPLARVFPVAAAGRGAWRRPPGVPPEIPDPQELRRRAFAALRELLARLGDRRPLVLAIDDLQWGDADSAALLAELLRPPDPPVLLLLGCYRSEDAGDQPAPAGPPRRARRRSPALDRRELAVEALTPGRGRGPGPDAARPARTPVARAQAEAIARESGGNPFFVAELVRYRPGRSAGSTDRPPRSGEVALDEVLWARVGACRRRRDGSWRSSRSRAGRSVRRRPAGPPGWSAEGARRWPSCGPAA